MTFQREYVASDFDQMSTEKIREIRGVARQRLDALDREREALHLNYADGIDWDRKTCGERDYWLLIVLRHSARVITERFDAGRLTEEGS